MTVTKVHTEYRESMLNQIASNGSYIAYGLRPGHIRVLSKETASLALFKGHTAQVRLAHSHHVTITLCVMSTYQLYLVSTLQARSTIYVHVL